ncbi:MAG: YIP1 family protein [Ignavibacteriae bacterium]|nr:YIP1 family protein [Ignavibacteriota bacterium]
MSELYEQQTSQAPAEETQTAELVEPMTISDKFVGIFSEPSATFLNIRQSGPRVSDWLVPLLALTVILLAGTLIRFSNPEFMADIMQKQQEAMQQQVESGKITQEQADQFSEQMGSMGGLQKIFSAIGVMIGVPIVFFLVALVYWLLVRFVMRGDISFTMLLSVYGLTAYISIVDQLLSILLGYALNNFYATLSPAAFLTPDLASPVYKLLSNLNPLSIWAYFLFALGLHHAGYLSKAKAFGLVFGLWIVWVLGSAFISLPFMGG